MTNLIILRGPSASGKSTVAKKLRNHLEGPVALLDFDVFRDTFLDKKGDYYLVASKLLMQTTETALEARYDVIVDGFYRMENYPDLLPELIENHPQNNYMFYFDVSLETTIKRHQHRDKANEFGEKELREWYYKPSASGIYEFEHKISEELDVQETVDLILETMK